MFDVEAAGGPGSRQHATGVAGDVYQHAPSLLAPPRHPRLQVFDADFYRQPAVQALTEEHKKVTGEAKLPRGGYPDMGEHACLWTTMLAAVPAAPSSFTPSPPHCVLVQVPAATRSCCRTPRGTSSTADSGLITTTSSE